MKNAMPFIIAALAVVLLAPSAAAQELTPDSEESGRQRPGVHQGQKAHRFPFDKVEQYLSEEEKEVIEAHKATMQEVHERFKNALSDLGDNASTEERLELKTQMRAELKALKEESKDEIKAIIERLKENPEIQAERKETRKENRGERGERGDREDRGDKEDGEKRGKKMRRHIQNSENAPEEVKELIESFQDRRVALKAELDESDADQETIREAMKELHSEMRSALKALRSTDNENL